MKLLVLGGTAFLGRHLVEEALARGYEVTLFTRGQRNPGLFDGRAEHLIGNRDGGLAPLRGRRWDAVVDTSGYLPRVVRASAELLANAADHYTFVSSISVYAEARQPGIHETAVVATLADPSVEEVTGETYGPLKAYSEQAAMAAFGPDRTAVVRPGLIVGPYDPTDRFTYWPARVATGGEVLAPVGPDLPVQVIDARDLAAWILNLAATRTAGVFNATGPEIPLPMGDVLDTSLAISGGDAQFTWVPESFLLEHEVGPWVELPLWVTVEDRGITTVDVRRALSAGLTFRPLAETIRDTLAWNATRAADTPRRAGLDPEKERALLSSWRARNWI